MAIKYSDVINLLRTNYKGTIKASDPDFSGLCFNAKNKSENAYGGSYYPIYNVSLNGINHVNFNSNNKNWQMLYPFHGTIHFFVLNNNIQNNNYIRFGWNTLVNFLKIEKIPFDNTGNNFSLYMNYYYSNTNQINFNKWGDDVAYFMGGGSVTLPLKNTYNNGNIMFTDLKTNVNGFSSILFFAAKIPYNLGNGWDFGVGFIFKDIHNKMDFFKTKVGINMPSMYNFNVWVNNLNPTDSEFWAYDVDKIIKIKDFESHDRNNFEELYPNISLVDKI